MKKYIGLIGFPLRHSLSPVIQQAALDYYNLDISYMLWETTRDDLPEAIRKLRMQQNIGANVTVPYKETVIALLDDIADMAVQIGAVNTIIKKDGKLTGLNTDVRGFSDALKNYTGFITAGNKAVVLGAGGAARAVCFSLLHEGIKSILIVNRDVARANRLKEHLLRYCAEKRLAKEITVVPLYENDLKSRLADSGLLVNCTTFGMKHGELEFISPLAQEVIPADALVYDLVYNPNRTPLIKAAQAAGAETLGGLPMLVYQGAASFELWTGKQAPVEVMMKAAEKQLANNEKV